MPAVSAEPYPAAGWGTTCCRCTPRPRTLAIGLGRKCSKCPSTRIQSSILELNSIIDVLSIFCQTLVPVSSATDFLRNVSGTSGRHRSLEKGNHMMGLCVDRYVCVCVCERERAKERECVRVSVSVNVSVSLSVHVCVCVCV